MEFNWSLATKAVAFCVLFAILLFKTQVQVAKYAMGKTTVAKHYEHYDTLEFPAISVCPGYRPDVAMELGWPTFSSIKRNLTVAAKNYPKSKGETEEQWEALNYPMGDIFAKMPNNAVILERDTSNGRCFTVLGLEPAKHGFDTMLGMTLTPRRPLKIFIHDRAAAMGLNSLFWTSNMSITALAMDKGGAIDVTMVKTVSISKHGSNMDVDEYHRALIAWVDNEFRKGEGVCWNPSFRSLLSNETLEVVPPCTDYYTYANSCNIFYDLLKTHVDPQLTGVVQPKKIPHYKVTTRDGTAMPKDNLRLFFFYESTMVAYEEEYVLLDFNGLVANIGGWLGLLVGLSFYSMVQIAADFARSHCKSRMVRVSSPVMKA